MKRFNCGLLILLTGLLAACGQAAKPANPDPPVGEPIARVNGKPIGKTAFELYVSNMERQSGGRPVTPEQRAQLLDQFIGMHLAADAGEKSGLTKDQKIADQLAYVRINVLADANMQKYLKEHPVKEEELKPAYDAEVATLPREYHTRHILVGDEAAAAALIKQIKGGADFAKLAAKESRDSSKAAGGDIGWLTTDSMAKPYAAAVTALKPGEMTQAPVQTEFGWHVIRLEESRSQEAPPFEDVKSQVEMLVKRKRVESYLETLRKSAKIEKLEKSEPADKTVKTEPPAPAKS